MASQSMQNQTNRNPRNKKQANRPMNKEFSKKTSQKDTSRDFSKNKESKSDFGEEDTYGRHGMDDDADRNE